MQTISEGGVEMTERFNGGLSSGGPLECLLQPDENSAYFLLIMKTVKVPGNVMKGDLLFFCSCCCSFTRRPYWRLGVKIRSSRKRKKEPRTKTECDVASPTGSTGYRCLNFRLRIIGCKLHFVRCRRWPPTGNPPGFRLEAGGTDRSSSPQNKHSCYVL